MTAINEAFPNKYFIFSIIEKKDIINQIKKLNQKRLSKTLNTWQNFRGLICFAENIYVFFSKAIESTKFPSSLKLKNIMPVFKNFSKIQK